MRNLKNIASLLCIYILLASGLAYSQEEAVSDKSPDTLALSKELHTSRQTALVTAAEKAGDSVVSIGAERTAYIRRSPFMDEGFPFFYQPGPTVEKYRQKTPYLGSGVVVDDKGHVVTNHHVIEGADKVFVTLASGTEYEAEIVEFDPISDLCLLKIDAENLKPAVLGDSDDLRMGEWVLAIGNPYGALLGDPCPTITAGVVSATNRFFRTTGKKPHLYENMIQTDAAINPGNSGGALVNAAGEVVGVNTFIFSGSGGSIGIGFAIPINRVKRMLDEVTQYGRLREIKLDFEVIDITRYVQQAMELDSAQGVLVYRIAAKSSAHEAGLEPGDIILKVNEHDVTSRREFLIHVLGAPLDEKIRF
ncbi:MAG: S1C family serine protease [Candidatus Sumerlaeota bacterium]